MWRIFRGLFLVTFGLVAASAQAATTSGALRMETITAYNLVVDSNIETPAGKSPSAAHMGVKITNTGSVPLTNVVVNIGNMTGPGVGTPGVFAERTPTALETGGQYAGAFKLQMPSGPADAVRVIPTIAPGETVVQYFFITYPLLDGPPGTGRSVTGAASVPEDDLWLNYDIWASAYDGVTTRQVDERTKVTMRNEISAMANKIWPNGSNKVPDEYLNAIQATVGWRPEAGVTRIPGAVVMEGIWYDLGNVGAGFDNNLDGIPDRNAWMQPVGDPSKFSSLAARMVKCYGLVIVKLNDGTEQLIPFEDRLYFENIPANNTGVVGLVFYEFIPLDLTRPALLSPYQEVASGYDNEKFNSDYGASVGSVSGTPPLVAFDKTGPVSIAGGGTATYILSATNNEPVNSSKVFGWPDLSLPLVFQDTIPTGLVYVAGSATSNNAPGQTYTVYWSTNGGTSWLASEPDPTLVTNIRWIMSGSLARTQTAAVQFQATVPSNYVGASVDNTACLKTGTETNFACDTTTTRVTGINSLGNYVWRDEDRDGTQNDGATGIPNIGVSLYVDTDNDGVLDTGEPLYDTTSTDINGAYLFSNLPDRKYIAVVNSTDGDLPIGYTLKTDRPNFFAVDLDSAGLSGTAVTFLDADWPFIKALEVVKSVTPTTYKEGDLITYNVAMTNHTAALTGSVSPQQTAYAVTVTGKNTPQLAGNVSGAPDGVSGNIDFSANADDFTTSGGLPFTGTGSTTFNKVELLLRMKVTRPMEATTPDEVTLQLGVSGAAVATYAPSGVNPLSPTVLNSLVAATEDTVIDITSKVGPSWTLAQAQTLVVKLLANKNSGPDKANILIDSIGVRVTGTGVLGSYGSSTIFPLPLTDTYDSTKLQYVSASVSPTSTSTSVPTAATLYWSDVGLLNPGTTNNITVTFRALPVTNTTGDAARDSTTTTNTAAATNAYFVSGRRTNDASSSVDVTITPTGSIGDYVFWDVNSDGIQNSGDLGLQGVIVSLFTSNGTLYRQTLTDVNGAYLFRGVIDGSYYVSIATATNNEEFSLPWSTFTQTFDPNGSPYSGTGPTITINNLDTVTTNDNYTDQDFGFTSTLSLISGTIFTDHNGNGVQDVGDDAISGLTVIRNGSGTLAERTRTTDANGFYIFGDLAAATYTVTVTPPGSTTQTLDPDLLPGVTTGDNATTVTVLAGVAYINRNFAYRPTGLLTLGDTLYYDFNNNNIQDVGEPGIANVTTNLYNDVNGDGLIDALRDALVATSVTNASGIYGYTGLLAGNYIMAVNLNDPDFPVGVSQTQAFDGIPDSKAKIYLTASINTVDLGYVPDAVGTGTGSIGNLVWFDANNNGIQDAAELGIDGVTVQLYRSVQTPGVSTPLATTITSGGGLYVFSTLPDGSYVVYLPGSNFTDPGALVNIPLSSTTTGTTDDQVINDDNGIQPSIATAVTSPLITLSAAETDITVDFGFTGVGSVGDFVFYDSNGNGSQDFSEAGISGVIVKIFLDANADGVADTPGSPVATTTTSNGSGGNPVGSYRFNDLAPGTYFVLVDTATLPAGVTYTSDPDRDGIPVGSPPALPTGDHADSLVIVSSGSSYSGADFGYKPPGAIGDFVWLDLNQNGIADPGEPGLAGVEITITDGVTPQTVFTDFDGYWSAIVADGSWTVTVNASNFAAAGPLENRLRTFDADGIGTANVTSIVLASGVVTTPSGLSQGNLGIDFGYKLNGIYGLSGTIAIHDTGVIGTADDVDDFYDDGVDMDAGAADEVELSGVEVFLFTSGGDFLGSKFTDANGDYSFTGLAGSSSYKVIIGTTAAPLDYSTLTTTTANAGGPIVTPFPALPGTPTSVTQLVSIGSSSVVNVDFTFNSTVDYDFGDLPSSYSSTTLGQDGARHIIPGGGSLYLGTAPDADTNGLPSSLANGDDSFGSDDENGVTPVSISTWADGAGGGSIQVTVTGSGWLVGWIDWNHDGSLLDSGEFVVSQAVTAATSTISFAIPAGTIGVTSESWLSRFRLFTTEPAFPLFSYEGVATNGEVEDHLFERLVAGSIGDIVWIDLDGDGVKDSNEEGIGGITVQASYGATTVSQTTGTGLNDVDGDGVIDPVGYYRFRGLAADTYTITVTTPPSGYTVSYDENGIGTPHVTSVTLVANEQHLTADFGYAPLLADISGTVYFDTDISTTITGPDTTASFVRMQLFTDPNGDGDPSDGVQVRETYTNASGYYEFVDVPTGNYVVVEVNPPGVASVFDVAGANDDRIPVVMAGSDITSRNFLDTQPTLYSVAGTVYDDSAANNDLINDGVDSRVAGVTVNLYIDRDGNGVFATGDTLWATTTTNSTGDYLFGGLYPGNYVVEKINPAGGSVTNDWDAKTPLNDSQIGVQIVSTNIEDRDFLIDGYHVSIGDFTWIDADEDGQQDVGEIGLGGVVVQLRDSGGVTVLATQTTSNGSQDVDGDGVIDPLGYYNFTGRPPGTYQVNFSNFARYGRTPSDQGADGTDSDANLGNGNTANIVLAAGDSNSTIDAGYYTCPDDWAAWKAMHPSEGPTGSPAANTDLDNYDNLAEFAFHMPYDSGIGSVHLDHTAWIVRESTIAPGTVEAVFVRPTGAYLNVVYTLQYAAAIGSPTTTWSTLVINTGLGGNATTVNNGDCTETVTIHDLATHTTLTGGEGVVRIRAELDDDGGYDQVDYTTYTEPEGWTITDFAVCCQSYNNPYARESVYTGTVSAVSAQQISFASELLLGSVLEVGESYYIEVETGVHEGHRYDVASSAAGSLTLATDSDIHAATAPFNTTTTAPQQTLVGARVALRRHWKLAQLFPILDHVATGSQTTADQVQVFAAGAWKIYWLYDQNDGNATTAIWVDAADGLMADQAAVIIPPGQGMLFNNRRITARTKLSYGEVRVNDFIRPLPIGRSFVGGGYPLDQYAADHVDAPASAPGRQMTKAVGFFGSRDHTTADSFFLWNADTIAQGRSYSTYFFHDATPKAPPLIRWVVVGDNVIATRDEEVHFKSDRAVFIRTKNGLPAYTIPSPWAP